MMRLPGLRILRSLRADASDVTVRLFAFALVGASGLGIDVACYLGLQRAGLEHRTARFVSFWPAASWNANRAGRGTSGYRRRE